MKNFFTATHLHDAAQDDTVLDVTRLYPLDSSDSDETRFEPPVYCEQSRDWEAFKTSPDFVILKQQFERTLTRLNEWCEEQGLEPKTTWTDFATRVFDGSISEAVGKNMYSDGKHVVETLTLQLIQPENMAHKKEVMKAVILEKHLTVCLDGARSNLQNASSFIRKGYAAIR